LLGLCFFMLPFVASFINGAGARMRIYAEPFILAVASYGLVFYWNSLKKLYLYKQDICK